MVTCGTEADGRSPSRGPGAFCTRWAQIIAAGTRGQGRVPSGVRGRRAVEGALAHLPENAASRALCARHGFREVGVYEKHAKHDGVWRDVVTVERLLV